MFAREDKENESTQDNERTGKLLVAEPSGQKPRRSVLKEFDPFAPESPCPVIQKIKSKIDEEELFEDAETSLTSFICKNNETKSKSPKNATTSNHDILLIPDLMEYCPSKLKANDTADLSYKEALENLSQSIELEDDSSEDVEFKPKATENRSVCVENNFQNGVLLNSTQDLNNTYKSNDTDIIQTCGLNKINTSNLNVSLHDVTFELHSNQSEILNNCNKISESRNQTFEKDTVLKTDKNLEEVHTNQICDKSIDLVQNKTSLESSNKGSEAVSVKNFDSNYSHLATNVDNSFIKEELNEVNQQTMEAYLEPRTEKLSVANTNTNLCEAKNVALETKDDNLVENQKIYVNVASLTPDKTGDILIAGYKDKIVESPSQSSLHAYDKKETEHSEHIFSQSNCSISQNIENQPVSLQDILNVDTSSLSKKDNSNISLTMTAEDKVADPEKLLEALAQSFNHTIDIEESAIVDYANSSTSPNSSSGLENEDLNVTVDLPTVNNENVKGEAKGAERVGGSLEKVKDSAIVDDINSFSSSNTSSGLKNEDLNLTIDLPTNNSEIVKSEEKSTKVVDKSFEKGKDLKRQSLSSDKTILGNKEVSKLSQELVTQVEPNNIVCEKNLEFDDFEEICKANVLIKDKEHIKEDRDKKYDLKGESAKDSLNNISYTKTQNSKEPDTAKFADERLASEVESNSNEICQIPDTQEFEDLEQHCNGNFSEPDLSTDTSYVKATFSNKEMDVTKSSEEIVAQVEKDFLNNTSYVKTPFTSKVTNAVNASKETVSQEVEPNYNKVYQRQDTQEFEDIEQQCKSDFFKQNPAIDTSYIKTTCSIKEVDVTKSSKEIVFQVEQDSSNTDSDLKTVFNSEETAVREVEPIYTKLYQRQDTQEFEDLELKCNKNLSEHQDSLKTTTFVETPSSEENNASKFCNEIIAQEVKQDFSNITSYVETLSNSKETIAIKPSVETVAQEVQPNYNKVYQRQDTQEFEDLEQRCKRNLSEQQDSLKDTSFVKTSFNSEESDATKSCVETISQEVDQDSLNVTRYVETPVYSKETNAIKASVETVAQEVQPNYNKVYQRQDTQEFEDLEQRCKRNLSEQQDSLKDTSFVKTSFNSKEKDATKSCVQLIAQEVDQDSLHVTRFVETPVYSKETNAIKASEETDAQEVEPNHNKVYQRQDIREFEDNEQRLSEQECHNLKQKCNADVSEPTKVLCGLQLSKENVQNLKTEEQIKKPDPVGEAIYGKVEIENLHTKQCADHVKIRVSGNFCNAVSKNCDPQKVEETVGITSRTNSENDDPCTNKTNLNFDLQQVRRQTNAYNNTTSEIINENGNLLSEETNETKKRTEVLITNKNEQATNENQKLNKGAIKPECRPSTRTMRNKTQVIDTKYVDEQLKEYQTKNIELKHEMDTLKTEIDMIKKDNMKKDKLILTCALDIEVERCTIVHYKKVVDEYEQVINSQCEKLNNLREESEKNAKQFTAFEMAFADVFEKYQKAKGTIEQYKKNEEILQSNLQNADDQMTKLQAKCTFMKEQYKEQIRKAEEQLAFEKEKYKQELSKLETIVKRLEIKSSSLETSLKQKTEECRALAALCDDITGNAM